MVRFCTIEKLSDKFKKKYNSVFNVDTKLKTMTGEPMRIKLVDNVNIKLLDLDELRGQLVIIPQQPFLFR